MLENGSILTKDIFSWLPQIYNSYWMSHEWLFEVILGLLEKCFPHYHILIYTITSISLLLLTMFLLNKEKWLKNILFTLVWFTGSMFFLVTYTTARPQLIVFIFLAIVLYLLDDLY